MKKIGLVGGISWVSTMEYYRLINEGVNSKLGGLNFADCIVYSLNFNDIQEKTWENAYPFLLSASTTLVQSKVDAIALCANTAHLFADQLQEEIKTPLIHIGTETAKAVHQSGIRKVALIGTVYTMEKDFFTQKFYDRGIDVIVPAQRDTRDYIQQTLKEELGKGILNIETKQRYIAMVNDLIAQGAAGVIFGCTEIPLLLAATDFPVPVFDTMRIHVDAIVDFMLS